MFAKPYLCHRLKVCKINRGVNESEWQYDFIKIICHLSYKCLHWNISTNWFSEFTSKQAETIFTDDSVVTKASGLHLYSVLCLYSDTDFDVADTCEMWQFSNSLPPN